MSHEMSELMLEQPPRIQIPKRGQESVWNYPRPPRLERVSQQIRVEFGGLVLAETTQGLSPSRNCQPPSILFPTCGCSNCLLDAELQANRMQVEGRRTLLVPKGSKTSGVRGSMELPQSQGRV